MIKPVLRVLLTVCCVSLLLAGCSHGGKDTVASDSDTVQAASSEEEPSSAMIELCADSVYVVGGGAVAVGEEVKKLPERVEGLYDKIERESSDGIEQLHFMLDDDYIFTALDFGSGKVDLLMANTFKVCASDAAEPTDPITLSVPFTRVLELPGVMPEWCDYDDSGMWYWTWKGLWFAPDQSHLTPGLSSRLYNEEEMPRPTDFDESVTVGYLGTGCPF